MLKKNQTELKNQYLTTIYSGILKGKPIKEIHKELYTQTINSKAPDKKTYETACKMANQIKKKLPAKEFILGIAKDHHPKYADQINTREEAIALFIIALMRHLKTDEVITRSMNEKRQEEENKAKEQAIDDDLRHNRRLENPKVFYLCSKHNDCALDHIHLQGKIYIDAQWRTWVHDEELIAQIEQYIQENDVMELQTVTHRPYWLITRPHCRHYFKAIDTQQVLKKSVKRLLQKYNMKKKIGERSYIQTMDSGVGTWKRKVIGEYRNAQLMVEKYQERLNTLNELVKVKNSPMLQDMIVKTRFLINKWKRYMRRLELQEKYIK